MIKSSHVLAVRITWFACRSSLLFLLPVNALDRTLVHGFLDFFFRGAMGVNHLRMPQGFVEAEYFRTDLLAIATGYAFVNINGG